MVTPVTSERLEIVPCLILHDLFISQKKTENKKKEKVHIFFFHFLSSLYHEPTL